MMSSLFSSSCSSGSEVANFVVSSGLLKHCWDQILDCYGGEGVDHLNSDLQPDLGLSLRWKACQQPKLNIIAFVTNPVCTKFHLQHQEAQHLVSSTTLPLHLHDFLFSNANSLSIHKAAITLFAAHINQLSQLKHQAQAVCSSSSSIPLIITGHSLGGSIASLFTLWLLQGLDVSACSIRKRPLCLTFGSPLVGDKGFQHAISQHPAGNSCFLHVATREDSIPGLFIADHRSFAPANHYKPFGTFLLCCETGCTCSNDPEAISELLVAMGLGRSAAEEQQPFVDYGKIVEQLESLIIIQGMSKLSDFMPNPIRAGTILQLEAIGLQRRQQLNSELDSLIKTLEKLEETYMLNKRKIFDPAKKLNDIKVKMALLEWYKKVCKAEEIGYYDSYKNQFSQKDRDTVKHKKFLTNYWKEIVSEIERNPQKGKMYLRKRWLYSGATYRRMIEPLDIADYYKSGKRNYIANGRSEHYIKMEKWLEEAETTSGSFSMQTNKPNVEAILTEDSCFWAHVEEARLWCKTLENADNNMSIDIDKESSRQKLMKFEVYVMEQINKSSVSSEIFLKGSSFMQWWKEYDKIIGPYYHNLPLTDFMRNCKYQQYASGCLALEKFIRY